MKQLPPAFRSIPSGVELLAALADAFASHRGWVHAVGFVEDVELRLGGAAADVRRAFRGRFAMAQLQGPLGGPYGVTLSRAEGDRVEVLAGVLLLATSAGVSALCLSATGERLGAEAGDSAPIAAASAALSAPLAPETAALPPSFAARVAAVVDAHDEEDEPVAELPARGDLVDHFTFGRCEVLRIEGDRLILRDLRGPGRIREIASDRLAVSGPLEHDGKRLFRLDRR